MDVFIYPGDSTKIAKHIPGAKPEPKLEYKYLEVIMHGETEGRFLQDPNAEELHDKCTMGQVLRLCGFRRRLIRREADHYLSRNF